MLSSNMSYVLRVCKGDTLHALLHEMLLNEEGKSQRQLAKEFNVSLPTINKHLRDLARWELLDLDGNTRSMTYEGLPLQDWQYDKLVDTIGWEEI